MHGDPTGLGCASCSGLSWRRRPTRSPGPGGARWLVARGVNQHRVQIEQAGSDPAPLAARSGSPAQLLGGDPCASTSDATLDQATLGTTAPRPAKVARPRSDPATTRSDPTTWRIAAAVRQPA